MAVVRGRLRCGMVGKVAYYWLTEGSDFPSRLCALIQGREERRAIYS